MAHIFNSFLEIPRIKLNHKLVGSVQCIRSGRDEPPTASPVPPSRVLCRGLLGAEGFINYHLKEQSVHYLKLDISSIKIKVFQTVRNLIIINDISIN